MGGEDQAQKRSRLKPKLTGTVYKNYPTVAHYKHSLDHNDAESDYIDHHFSWSNDVYEPVFGMDYSVLPNDQIIMEDGSTMRP